MKKWLPSPLDATYPDTPSLWSINTRSLAPDTSMTGEGQGILGLSTETKGGGGQVHVQFILGLPLSLQKLPPENGYSELLLF